MLGELVRYVDKGEAEVEVRIRFVILPPEPATLYSPGSGLGYEILEVSPEAFWQAIERDPAVQEEILETSAVLLREAELEERFWREELEQCRRMEAEEARREWND
jgi:hypothetical protein